MKISWKTALGALWLSGLVSGAVILATPAQACDEGSWADPSHAYVCQGFPPPYSPGYRQPPSNTLPMPPNSRQYPY